MNMEHYKIFEGGNANMTSLGGYVNASYYDLVELFGEPTYGMSGDGKVDIEWVLTIEDLKEDESRVVTLYNWKDYDGGREAKSNPSYRWHIGSRGSMEVAILKQYIESKMKEIV